MAVITGVFQDYNPANLSIDSLGLTESGTLGEAVKKGKGVVWVIHIYIYIYMQTNRRIRYIGG